MREKDYEIFLKAKSFAVSSMVTQLVDLLVKEEIRDVIKRLPDLKGEERKEAVRIIVTRLVREYCNLISICVSSLCFVGSTGEQFLYDESMTPEEAQQQAMSTPYLDTAVRNVLKAVEENIPIVKEVGVVDALLRDMEQPDYSKVEKWLDEQLKEKE
jgi:hypothetical protein